VTKFSYIRHCPVIIYKNLKILAVHLEIGKRYHHLNSTDKNRIKIEKENSIRRINQLKEIFNIHKDIDIIVGDFNFTYNDPEFNWLINQKFEYCQDFQDSTPFNRTDMVFIRDKELLNINNITIKCNYSDHLLILCELKNMKLN